MAVVRVFVAVDSKTHFTEVSEDTARRFQGAADFRKRPVGYYLTRVVKEYGELSEANILKLLDEKLVPLGIPD